MLPVDAEQSLRRAELARLIRYSRRTAKDTEPNGWFLHHYAAPAEERVSCSLQGCSEQQELAGSGGLCQPAVPPNNTKAGCSTEAPAPYPSGPESSLNVISGLRMVHLALEAA